jgi:glycosyltransferase involved in cell wall biosynthesis
MKRSEPMIDLTVMICTWNNAVQLDRTLTSFGSCRIPAGITWEVIVVNNDCSKTTDSVVANHLGTLPVVLVHEPLPGLSRARNRGLQAARGKLVVFTDDDVTVREGWLEAYWEALLPAPVVSSEVPSGVGSTGRRRTHVCSDSHRPRSRAWSTAGTAGCSGRASISSVRIGRAPASFSIRSGASTSREG